jgi:hypothetical protein
VLRQELGDIVCASVDDNPARVAIVVLRNLLTSELHFLGVVAVVVHGDNVYTAWRIRKEVLSLKNNGDR